MFAFGFLEDNPMMLGLHMNIIFRHNIFYPLFKCKPKIECFVYSNYMKCYVCTVRFLELQHPFSGFIL